MDSTFKWSPNWMVRLAHPNHRNASTSKLPHCPIKDSYRWFNIVQSNHYHNRVKHKYKRRVGKTFPKHSFTITVILSWHSQQVQLISYIPNSFSSDLQTISYDEGLNFPLFRQTEVLFKAKPLRNHNFVSNQHEEDQLLRSNKASKAPYQCYLSSYYGMQTHQRWVLIQKLLENWVPNSIIFQNLYCPFSDYPLVCGQ